VNDQPHVIRRTRVFTPPNALSFLRMLMLGPTLAALADQDRIGNLPAIVLLGSALGTDAVDGLLARKRGWVSDWGRVLDPLADKVYLGGVVLYLALARDFPTWLVVLVLARDLFLIVTSALLVRRYNVVFSPNLWGKATTVVLGVLIFAYVLRADAVKAPLLATAVIGLALSLIGYVRTAVRFVRARQAGSV
jgi:CDP-diacylglycerol--glycerol-3-phosphate 3-phosphatidyltransferase